MEMWCPDDIGRDSWDWVGPPAWVRACFNSPEWGGGSSPVKTEPHQIVLLLLLLLLFQRRLRCEMCTTTNNQRSNRQWANEHGALDDEELFTVEAPAALSRKKTPETAKK